MFYLPSLRRFLLPALISLAVVVFYRSSLHVPTSIQTFVLYQPHPQPKQGIRINITEIQQHTIPHRNASENHLSPDQSYFYSYGKSSSSNGTSRDANWLRPADHPHLAPLFKCPIRPNPYTNHIRIPNIIQNVSQIPANWKQGDVLKFNPTIISLPYWSENQYLLVSRVVTEGLHQEAFICEANICYAGAGGERRKGELNCTEDDLETLGPAGGLRCANPPIVLGVPPTPAEHCEGGWTAYADIPGFHDPRIFWSGKGEPLMILNTQSRYTCFGLWIIDLRTLYAPLKPLLSSSPRVPSLGPLMSYTHLTELTRNPASTRGPVEKNWLLFFPTPDSAFLHYDLSPSKRTFAKLLGNGFTTTNLTDPLEQPCLQDKPDPRGKMGHWHQATNSLRLVLCHRSDKSCKHTTENTVFFAIVHRKYSNYLNLPLRYERYFVVWSAIPPFQLLAMSKHPVLLYNETASGWTAKQNWEGESEHEHMHMMSGAKLQARNSTSTSSYSNHTVEEEQGPTPQRLQVGKDNWAYFTYTVSIAWSFSRVLNPEKSGGDELTDKNTGFLDDEVVLGIGVDDMAQTFGRARAEVLLGCLRGCPGRKREVPLEEEESTEKEAVGDVEGGWDVKESGTERERKRGAVREKGKAVVVDSNDMEMPADEQEGKKRE